MSKNVTIMNYEVDKAGHIYEPNGKIVETAFIPPVLIDVFRSMDFIRIRRLFEMMGGEDFLEIECIDDIHVDDIIILLESELVKVITSDEAGSIKDLLVKEEMDFLMRELRTITNLHHLFKLKRDNFSSHPGSVIKIG